MEQRVSPDWIKVLEDNQVYVFGSNLAGAHGGGAARYAYEHFEAEWGVGVGPTGRCYAIPTMQGGVDTIRPYVEQFIEYARQNTAIVFLVTKIGCGIAGFTCREIAPLFKSALGMENVALPKEFIEILTEE